MGHGARVLIDRLRGRQKSDIMSTIVKQRHMQTLSNSKENLMFQRRGPERDPKCRRRQKCEIMSEIMIQKPI